MAKKPIKPDYENLEVNEPYLGPWWAVLMVAVYLIEKAFPTEPYTLWWYLFIYVITLLIVVTVFTIYKRVKFNSWQRGKKPDSE